MSSEIVPSTSDLSTAMATFVQPNQDKIHDSPTFKSVEFSQRQFTGAKDSRKSSIEEQKLTFLQLTESSKRAVKLQSRTFNNHESMTSQESHSRKTEFMETSLKDPKADYQRIFKNNYLMTSNTSC